MQFFSVDRDLLTLDLGHEIGEVGDFKDLYLLSDSHDVLPKSLNIGGYVLDVYGKVLEFIGDGLLLILLLLVELIALPPPVFQPLPQPLLLSATLADQGLQVFLADLLLEVTDLSLEGLGLLEQLGKESMLPAVEVGDDDLFVGAG